MTKKETIIVLFSITLCWSSSYIFIKDLSSAFSAYAYLTLTSGFAGIGLAIAFRNLFRKLDRKTFLYGSILAFLIAGNIIFEKLALDNLPASAVSAIASMNIVIVPLIMICRRRFPSRNNVAGIAIILLGLAVSGHLHMQGGELIGIIYVLLSCLMMSLYTVFAADYTKEADPLLLTTLQLCVTAVIGLLLWVVTDPGSITTINWSLETFSYIVIIAFFSKAYAYVMLMYSEKYCDAITVTVIAATDPVVTLILAILIPSTLGNTELFSTRSLLGAILIAIGAVVAGTNFLSARKDRAGITEGASPDNAQDPEVTAHTAEGTAPASDAAISAATIKEPAAASGRLVDRRLLLRVFFALMIGFALLGMSINVMEYADGYTEIRPENFIPVTAGILFGPVAAFACGIGNVLQDLPFDFGNTVILGFFANFLAAYLPYKLWRAAAGNTLNAHSTKRLLIYIWAALLSSLATGAFLSYGLEIFFGSWYETLGLGIFYNNFLFSLMFGLPSFIVLTSDGSHLGKLAAAYHPRCGLRVLEGLQPFALKLYALETILLSVIMLGFQYGIRWNSSIPGRVLWLVTFAVMVLCCLIPTPSESQRPFS
ncbi:MAG: EamA family transporter [Lachnospiraceae bacterium]|nr:EamA family transporter [Lachnospiraceae bacterium]